MTWATVPLSEVVRVRRGYDLPTRLRRPGSVAVISSGGHSGFHDQSMAVGPGVVLGRATNLGQPTWVDGPYWPHNTTLYVEDFCGNDPRWVYWWFMSHDLSGYNSGSVQPMLNRNYIAKVPVALPSLPEQQRIAGVLGAFDDLIETNQRLAQHQEELVQAAVLGPALVPLAHIAEFPRMRQTRPSGAVEHYSIPSYDATRLPAIEDGATIKSGKYSLDEPSTLLARLNPQTSRAWMAYPGDSAVCSTEFVVARGSGTVATEEVWAVTSTRDFWDQMREASGGTTNSHQRVDKGAVPTLLVPDVRLLSDHTRNAIVALVRGASQVRIEAQELARQRDELLPLLMSGKVRVSELGEVA